MGCATSSPQIVNSIDIDSELNKAKLQGKQKIKLLLLGGGESGKSTILKQMRILHGQSWSEEELRMYGVVVRSNVIVATRKLCMELRHLGLENKLAKESSSPTSFISPKQAYDILVAHLLDNVINEENESVQVEEDWVGHSPRAGGLANKDSRQFMRLWKYIQILMKSKTMRKVWTHYSVVNVMDGHAEYLQDVARIASASYCPTNRDILLARARTTHVTMERYNIQGIDFEFYDVGGQRALRHKWLDCFNNVDAVIFVAALSEYDQTLTEAKGPNRMVESLELFKAVCNHRAFQHSTIMLFLNKKDVFAEKIARNPISSQSPFSDYNGTQDDFNEGVQYFIDKFLDCLLSSSKKVFVHVTCATDSKNMEFVLDSTRAAILEENLKVSLRL